MKIFGSELTKKINNLVETAVNNKTLTTISDNINNLLKLQKNEIDKKVTILEEKLSKLSFITEDTSSKLSLDIIVNKNEINNKIVDFVSQFEGKIGK